jgi:hypothetical protein
VQLEAMACGLAACSPQIPKSGMSWVNGTDTISSDGDVVISIVNAINQLNKPSIRLSTKEACHHRYLEVFSRKVWLQQLQYFHAAIAK